ncbi:MAG: GerMN domain-containing protein, partial [Actinomycetota bacterium]|nr:GerMN domain-containing protein [Actinomycetota bacterium]
SSKSKKSKNEQYESKIVGSEYKVKKKKRKSGIPRAITTAILIVIVFFLGFFTFYAIDNELFSKKNNESASSSTELEESAASEEGGQEENIMSAAGEESESFRSAKTSDTGEQSSTSQSAEKSGEDSESGTGSFLQKIIMFFKSITGRDDDGDDYPERLSINIYFAMLGSEEIFNGEKRTIVAGSVKNAAINAVNELLKGPVAEYNFAVIPPGTKLLDVEIINDIARVDLSQEFLSNNLDTNILDEYIIYTIVDTLTEIKEIRAVVFLIDGKEIKEYGNVDLRLPAIRNEKYLENS